MNATDPMGTTGDASGQRLPSQINWPFTDHYAVTEINGYDVTDNPGALASAEAAGGDINGFNYNYMPPQQDYTVVSSGERDGGSEDDDSNGDLLGASLGASLAALNNSLNSIWEALGNGTLGSGLSNAADFEARAGATEDWITQWTDIGADPGSPAVSSLEESVDGLESEARLQLAASYTESGAVSGYGAFGLTGAEGISASATGGLFGAAAFGGALIGYGITQIPTGGGTNVGEQLGQFMYDLAPDVFDYIAK